MFALLLAWLSLNLDNSNLGQTLARERLSVEGVRAYFHNMSRGGETHFFICPNAQNTSYASKVWTPVWHVDPRTKDTSESIAWVRNCRTLHEKGVDYIQVLVDACREQKVSPWISMRMNDIHNIGDCVSWASSTFWLDHPEFRRVPNKLGGGSFDADLALDYTHREVREYALALVREMLERWDVDGIECDWLRFVHHVNAEAERTRTGCAALTELMREVRQVADEVGARRGRRVGVSVRVAAMPEAAYGLGCDAVDWAAKGYVDVVMPCNFFSTSDFAADWAQWKRRLRQANPKVKLVGGIDFFGVNREGLGPKGFTDGELSGYLERMTAAGISDVGFFNLFGYQATEVRKFIQVDGMPNLANWVRMRDRTYPVTYHDAVPEGFPSGKVLPAKLDTRRTFTISVGKVGLSDGVSVILAFDRDVSAGTSGFGFDVLLNGEKTTGVSSVPVATWMPGAKATKTVLKLAFPLSAAKDGKNVVTVGASQMPLRLHYVALHFGKDAPSCTGEKKVSDDETTVDVHVSAPPRFGVTASGGVPRLLVDGVVQPGMCVIPSSHVGPEDAASAVRPFADMGLRFACGTWWTRPPWPNHDWWRGEGDYDFEKFDLMLEALTEAMPNGWIMPRIVLNPPEWWMERHPGVTIGKNSSNLNPESSSWRQAFRRMLTDVVRHVEASRFGSRVCGYHLLGMHCGEWMVVPQFPPELIPPIDHDPLDPLPPCEKTSAFRSQELRVAGATADALLEAAAVVKSETRGQKLVCAFFGYLNADEHEDFARVLASPLVDVFASPLNYGFRLGGDSGVSQAPLFSSYRLHGKVFYEEADILTFLSPQDLSHKAKTPFESVNVIKRTIGWSLTSGTEIWWFLLGGNESFRDDGLMATVRRGFGEQLRTLCAAQPHAEVAVFTSVDEPVTSKAFGSGPRREFADRYTSCFHQRILPHSGVPFDAYALSDISDERLPSYRVYVFPNAFTLSGRQRAQIARRLRKDNATAVWMYASGYYRENRGSVSNVVELTGCPVRELFRRQERSPTHVFEIDGEPGRIWRGDGFDSAYFPELPTAAELRAVLRRAGVHVWLETDDVLFAGRGYVTVHAAEAGEKTVRLPAPSDVVEVYGLSAPRVAVTEFAERLEKGETRIYHLSSPPSRQENGTK